MNNKIFKNGSNLAGFILLVGTSIILITILFEYQIGWIGVQRPASEVPSFIFQAWPDLRNIWGWQMVGFALQAVAYLLFLKHTNELWRSLLWSILFLCGLLITIAFGITLGSYYPALQVYESQPVIFDSLRGAVRSLYSAGLLILLFLGIFYLLEVFGKDGVINKRWGIPGLGIVILGIVLSFVPSLPGKLIGAVIFFIPAFLGYAHWRNN